jgi:hypothetical protein
MVGGLQTRQVTSILRRWDDRSLGKVSSPRVISRQSVMQYKSSKKSLHEIAGELKVDAVLEGTVEPGRNAKQRRREHRPRPRRPNRFGSGRQPIPRMCSMSEFWRVAK